MFYDRVLKEIDMSKSEVRRAQRLAALGSNMGAVDPESRGSLQFRSDESVIADKRLTMMIVGGLVLHATGEVPTEDAIFDEKAARHFLLSNQLGRVYGYGLAGSSELFTYYREKFLSNEIETPELQEEADKYATALSGYNQAESI